MWLPRQSGQRQDSEVRPKARRQLWLEGRGREREVELGRPQGSGSRQEGSRLLENLGFYCEDIQESHDVTSFWQYSWGCWDWRRL